VSCTEPSFHSFVLNVTIAPADPASITDPDGANNSGSDSRIVGIVAAANLSVTNAAVNSPSTAAADAPFNVTMTATVANNSIFNTPVNVDTTFTLVEPGGCSAAANPVTVQDTVINKGASANLQATFSVTCTTLGGKTFEGSVSTAVDKQHISGSASADAAPDTTTVQKQADIKVTSVTVSAPDEAGTHQPFFVEVFALVHNNGPDTADVDVQIGLNAPPDCDVSRAENELATAASLGGTLAPSTPVAFEEGFWVVCSLPSSHLFTGTASAAITTANVFDTDPGNNSNEGSDTAAVFALADVKVNAVELIAPTAVLVDTAFDVTVRGTLHNNGDVTPANVQALFGLQLPQNCTAAQQTATQNVALPLSSQVIRQHTFSVTCDTEESVQLVGTVSVDVTDLHVTDPNEGNNEKGAEAVVEVAEPDLVDVKVTSVTVSAPASEQAGAPFNVDVTATLHNNGPTETVDVDVFFSLDVPSDCTVNKIVPVLTDTLADVSLRLSVNTPQSHSESYTVNCSEPSFHQFTANVLANVTTPLTLDTNPANNSNSGDATTAIESNADVKVTGVQVLVPDNIIVDVPFDVTVRAILHNNGAQTPVNVDALLNIDEIIGGGCVASPGGQAVEDQSLAASASVQVEREWTLVCSVEGAASLTASAHVAVAQLHVSDPNGENNSGIGGAQFEVSACPGGYFSSLHSPAAGASSQYTWRVDGCAAQDELSFVAVYGCWTEADIAAVSAAGDLGDIDASQISFGLAGFPDGTVVISGLSDGHLPLFVTLEFHQSYERGFEKAAVYIQQGPLGVVTFVDGPVCPETPEPTPLPSEPTPTPSPTPPTPTPSPTPTPPPEEPTPAPPTPTPPPPTPTPPPEEPTPAPPTPTPSPEEPTPTPTQATPTPTPAVAAEAATPAPTPAAVLPALLPPTGGDPGTGNGILSAMLLMLGGALLGAGIWLQRRARRLHDA
jgi:hypothetical protein